jgi:hypothetical protein
MPDPTALELLDEIERSCWDRSFAKVFAAIRARLVADEQGRAKLQAELAALKSVQPGEAERLLDRLTPLEPFTIEELRAAIRALEAKAAK